MVSELEITQEKVLETTYRYVLKIVLLLVGPDVAWSLKVLFVQQSKFCCCYFNSMSS